jgi:hypothetical protein
MPILIKPFLFLIAFGEAAIFRSAARAPRAATRQRRLRAAELASSHLIELHSVPCQPKPRMQDTELPRSSQEVTGRFYNGWPFAKAADIRRVPNAAMGEFSSHLRRCRP